MAARSVLAAVSPLLIAGAALWSTAGCNESAREPMGCVSDDACRAPRVCDKGLCVDPPVGDASADAVDASDASTDADTTEDVRVDVPPPRDIPPPPEPVDAGGPEIIEPPDVRDTAEDAPMDAEADVPPAVDVVTDTGDDIGAPPDAAIDASMDTAADTTVDGPCFRAVGEPDTIRTTTGTATPIEARWLNCGSTVLTVVEVGPELEAPAPAALDIVSQSPESGRVAPGETFRVALRFGATVRGRYGVFVLAVTDAATIMPSVWTTEVLVDSN